MAKGVVGEPIGYILESDLELPKEQQTIWYLRMRSSRDVTKAIVNFSKAERIGRGGKRELSEEQYNKADLNTFVSVVERVENFFFAVPSKKDLHEKYKGKGGVQIHSDEDGRDWIKVPVIEGEDLVDIWEVVSVRDMNELLEASNDYNKLSEASKKA